MANQEMLLSEIARKLRKLDCICDGVNTTGNIVIQNYQPVDCNGDPVGDPINVMPTITVAKQDVAICNTDAIVGTYNVPTMGIVPPNTAFSLITDLGIDVTKLHSISIVIIGTTGTVDMTGTLGGGSQTYATLPVGFSVSFTASTVFGTGDITFITSVVGDVTVIISCLSTL